MWGAIKKNRIGFHPQPLILRHFVSAEGNSFYFSHEKIANSDCNMLIPGMKAAG